MKSELDALLRGGRLFGPAMREDPYSVYDELRADDPVHWDAGMNAWVLTRYDDVSSVLNDVRFTSARVERARDRFADEFQPLLDVLGCRMSEYGGADHKRVRALVHDAFIRTAVERWEPVIRERVVQLIGTATTSDGQLEFMSGVAVPLPLSIILDLVGIPGADHARVKAWSDDFSNVALNLVAGLSDEELRSGMASVSAFRAYLVEHVRAIEESPRDDLLSAFVEIQHEGSRLSMDELLSNTLLLLAAGNETTTCLLGNGLAALLRSPDQLERLREGPTLLPNAIEEFLRYDAPVQFLARVAGEDVTMRDREIRKGDVVLAVIGSANRDPEHFDRPGELDIARPHDHHLAFGHGHHFCAGAQLARLEARVTFEVLLSGFARLELDGSRPLRHRENVNVRCLQELPLRMSVS